MSTDSTDRVVGVRDMPIDDIGADDQGLRMGDYAKALAEFIERTQTPMTIGIQGDWGSGKTSLMNLIEARVKGKFPTIWVNTWKYSQTEPGQTLSVAVFLAIIHQLKKKTPSEKTQQLASSLGKGLLRLMGKVVESQIGVNLADALEKGDLDAVFEKYEALENLKAELEKLVARVVEGQDPGTARVVVFVDDLDRVQPERAVEILEVLKVFLDVPRIVFVLACDYEVVLQGLRSRGGLGGEEVSGRSFFDKIIQVPFQMPSHGADKLENYLGALFGRVGATVSQPEQIRELVRVLQLTTGTNPRTIKRLVNILNLLLIVLDSEKHTWDDAVANKGSIVFALVALQNAFPEIYAHLSSRSESEVFAPFDVDEMKADPDLARCLERRKNLNVALLNDLLEILKSMVDGNGVLLLKFFRVSDIAAVQEKPAAPESKGPTHYAGRFIGDQTAEVQRVIRSVIAGLPGDVTYHGSRDRAVNYMWMHSKLNDFYAYVYVPRQGARVDVVFGASPTETVTGEGITYIERLRNMGCPGVGEVHQQMKKAQDGEEFIYCSLEPNASDAHVAAVRKYLSWFLVKAHE